MMHFLFVHERHGGMAERLPLLVFMVFMGYGIIRSFTHMQRARIRLPFSGLLFIQLFPETYSRLRE